MPGAPPANPPKSKLILMLVACLTLLAAGRAGAQLSQVQLDVQRDFLGLGGVVQRGVWTPVRLDLTNTSAENVEVTCRWLLEDEDEDEVIAERTNITLVPMLKQGVWLYANPPMSTRSNQTWVFQAVSTQTGELLTQAQVQLSSSAVVEPAVDLIGLCGFKDLGLNPWQRWSTRHEPIKLVRGLNIETLPDRWYGLEGLSSLVWFPVEGGEPTATRMSDSSKRALREWVYRGGHLVLVLPYGGQQWTSADSGLADLIEPLKPGDIKQARAIPPISVFGQLRDPDPEPVPLLWFDLADAEGYTTLAEVDLSQDTRPSQAGPNPGPPDPRPLIVGHRVGFGQVTLVGIDISETSVLKPIDSFRLHRVWTHIFSWRASHGRELVPPKQFEDQATANNYREAKDAQHYELGTWIAPRLSQQRDTAPAVGLAFVLFVIYAVAAGMTFPHLLRSRGWERHSWMIFVGIVALFSVLAWGGAWAMRPASSSATHFTVLDIDAQTNMVRARSWQSLLIPSFTTADIAIPSEAGGFSRMDVVNLLSSPGNTLAFDSPGHPDTQSYAFDTTQPSTLSVPMRSTTKSLRVDYLGSITGQQEGMDKPWTLPKAEITLNNGLPTGTITNRFPGQLIDVRIVFCQGGDQTVGPAGTPPSSKQVLVYEYRNAGNQSVWDPNTTIALPNSKNAYQPLWIRTKQSAGKRVWNQEGYLGQQIHGRKFSDRKIESMIAQDSVLLSFFGALPPPKYQVDPNTGFGGDSHDTYLRSLTRGLDITPLITGRRLIVIGHLRDSPSPIPMTVDGDPVQTDGWTVVRWIYDL